jgi:hypothetical protein
VTVITFESRESRGKCTAALGFLAFLLWDEIIIEKKGLRFWLHFAVRPEKGKDKNRGRISVMYRPSPSPPL